MNAILNQNDVLALAPLIEEMQDVCREAARPVLYARESDLIASSLKSCEGDLSTYAPLFNEDMREVCRVPVFSVEKNYKGQFIVSVWDSEEKITVEPIE